MLAAVAIGDRDAFRTLYTHYYALVEQYVRLFTPAKEMIDELTQDVFVRAWEKREKFATVISFKDYIFMVTRNQVFNYLKALKLERRFVEMEGDDSLTTAEGADHRLEFSQYYDIAMEAIEKLPTGRRQILKMSLEEGMSLDEIAQRLKISKSGVKNQLYAATAFVRQYLRDHAGISAVLFIFLSLFDS